MIMNCWWFSLLVVGIFFFFVCVCAGVFHIFLQYISIYTKIRQLRMFEGVGSIGTFGNTMIL